MALSRAFKNAVHQRRSKTPLVVNGDMAVAQRGTDAVTGLGDGDEGYVIQDRMRHTITAGAGRYTCKQTADAPSDSGFDKCLELDCTTADTSIAATEEFNLDYRIEGHDVQHLKYGTSDAEYLTLGFWMKADAAVVYSVGFIEVDNSRSIRQVFTTGTDWTYHCIPFIGDTVSGPNDDIGEGMRLRFCFHAGSNLTSGTLATSWQSTTAANTHVGGGSFFASTSRSIKMTGLQLERGYFTSETMPPFQHERCCQNLSQDVRGILLVTTVADGTRLGDGIFRSTTRALGCVDCTGLVPNMRATPSVATTITGHLQMYHGTDTTTNASASSGDGLAMNGHTECRTDFTLASGSTTAGYPGKLRANSAGAMEFEAEL
jgi:hypothetical protein